MGKDWGPHKGMFVEFVRSELKNGKERSVLVLYVTVTFAMLELSLYTHKLIRLEGTIDGSITNETAERLTLICSAA